MLYLTYTDFSGMNVQKAWKAKNEDVVACKCFHHLQLRAFELLTVQYISTVLGEAVWGRYVLRAEGFKFWTMETGFKKL